MLSNDAQRIRDFPSRKQQVTRPDPLNTVHRWMTRGVTVPGLTGPLILPSVRTGRGRFVMPQWLAVFLTLRDRPVSDPPRVDTPRQTTARHRRAMDRLRAMGVA